MCIFLFHFSSAIVLFLFTNWFGKKSLDYGYYQFSFYEDDSNPAFNILYRAISPVVFIFILSYILHILNFGYIDNIYYVVIYSCIIRIIFILATKRSRLINWIIFSITSIASIVISYIAYVNFILTREFLIPTKEDIATTLWFGFIGWIYKVVNDTSYFSNKSKRDRNYILYMRDIFYNKFSRIINDICKNEEEKNIVLSVLIYENFNRHIFIRILEKFMFFTKKVKTTGIMQVSSEKYLSDEESIQQGALILISEYRKNKEKLNQEEEYDIDYSSRRNSIKRYNPDIRYIDDVLGIYDILEANR